MEEIVIGAAALIFLAASTGGRCTEADKIQCGVNEVVQGEACACSPGYIRSYTGKCDQCDQGFLQSDVNGKMVCTAASDDRRALDESFKETDGMFESQMTSNFEEAHANSMFRGRPIFDDGSKILSKDQFTNEGENIPGFYPAFNSYKQAHFSSLDEISNATVQAASRKDWAPFVNNTRLNGTIRRNDRFVNYRYLDEEGSLHSMDIPNLQSFEIKRQPSIPGVNLIDQYS